MIKLKKNSGKSQLKLSCSSYRPLGEMVFISNWSYCYYYVGVSICIGYNCCVGCFYGLALFNWPSFASFWRSFMARSLLIFSCLCGFGFIAGFILISRGDNCRFVFCWVPRIGRVVNSGGMLTFSWCISSDVFGFIFFEVPDLLMLCKLLSTPRAKALISALFYIFAPVGYICKLISCIRADRVDITPGEAGM